MADTTIHTVRNAERGRVLQCPLGALVRIASALGVAVADLFPLLAPVRNRRKLGTKSGAKDERKLEV